MQPHIIITRPARQAQAFADALTDAHGAALPILIAPLMDIVPVDPADPLGSPDHIIFTSVNAVDQAVGLKIPAGVDAWCVGDQTSAAARNLGFRVHNAEGDAAALVAMIRHAQPSGKILHLCGRHVTGRVVETLQQAGLDASSRVVYDQVEVSPSAALEAALASETPVVVPLFSPRSARLLGRIPLISAAVTIVAISDKVAKTQAYGSASDVLTAKFPDKKHMISATLQAFEALSHRITP